MNKLTLWFCMAALSFSQAHAQTHTIEDPRFAGLDKEFNAILNTWHVAGFAVAVVEKDKIIYAKGFGFRDYEHKVPVTPNTLFAVGSNTKAFTAGLLGILRDQGKLDFEQPVRNFLPELVFATDELNEQVTLRDMMTHRTGIQRYDNSWFFFPPKSRDTLLYRIRYFKPHTPLRSQWEYNNFMYLAQGKVAEKLTGKSWEDNIRQYFFDPLEMSHSNLSVIDMVKQQDVALPYKVALDGSIKKQEYHNIDVIGPAGSINSNVLDMGNWVRMWLNGGKYKGKTVLPAAYVQEATGLQMAIWYNQPDKVHPDLHFNGYGLGWFLRSYRGHYQAEHGGNIDGFTALTCLFPTDSIGIVVLCNQGGSFVPDIVHNILADRALKLSKIDWYGEAEKKLHTVPPAEQKKKDTVIIKGTTVLRPLAELTGTYTNNLYGSFEVSRQHDSLFAKLPFKTVHLKHRGYDIFDAISEIDFIEINMTVIHFLMDDNGDINRLEMRLDDEPAVFIKQKSN
ncbi:serine hydrolase [Chitinophaga silvisoli]|uniref:Serine hydrolase n=1 Tax=Chitinophaga silvisoli TaxID=2291814 RepID=A0A3E1P3Q3_9BACT|nr:serine hydrolase [Chitinophaga silvisoli]RFM34801.1 serine hydrolase [Chitinophaga silvisoli]